MKRLSRLAIAALLAAAVAPAFARGMPQLPDDDGGRASVLQALNPARAVEDGRPHAAGVVPNRGGETSRGRDSGIDRRFGVAGDGDAR
ncbi:hypothetical protein CEQ23_04910 [Burkholderia cepacia]|uniref:Uncharacterized protein n=1 Tax=Burkholderia cepacia TaxID=292 RepID=A0ABM6NZ91_BURCE|nr:hypothetical protein DM41_6923 [Burkholderia cepacia ATCC 25416]ASE92925.1 hypothetical protein CEQ23_04910 [Burkholderia cepacia]ALK23012.1 hypothetical protein APZ15_34575 [Burkholderia cepacia ATCC 25416]ATF80052.1 hypothetical protein CO711_21865 [Burkholderia cepacia]QCY08326.1 hypothetical protein EJ998_35510 [Burkholderia cepacia ATCC 25416]